jgi:hypothetical protein
MRRFLRDITPGLLVTVFGLAALAFAMVRDYGG